MLCKTRRFAFLLMGGWGWYRGSAKAAWSTRTDDRETWTCDLTTCMLKEGKEVVVESDWRLLDCPGPGFEGCIYVN